MNNLQLIFVTSKLGLAPNDLTPQNASRCFYWDAEAAQKEWDKFVANGTYDIWWLFAPSTPFDEFGGIKFKPYKQHRAVAKKVVYNKQNLSEDVPKPSSGKTQFGQPIPAGGWQLSTKDFMFDVDKHSIGDLVSTDYIRNSIESYPLFWSWHKTIPHCAIYYKGEGYKKIPYILCPNKGRFLRSSKEALKEYGYTV